VSDAIRFELDGLAAIMEPHFAYEASDQRALDGGIPVRDGSRGVDELKGLRNDR